MASLIPDALRELMPDLPLPGSLAARSLADEVKDALARAPVALNEYGYDPYGFNPDTAASFLSIQALLYRYYFRVDNFDIENVPEGRVLLIVNHAGNFAWDAAMLTISMLLDAEPPRVCRGMGEYFLWKLPWVGNAGARTGMMVGTPANCIHMLENEQCVMVFPEGATGANKPFRKRYQLQKFGQGFMRLALQTDTPIVPVGIVGSEEQQPGFANFEKVGRAIGLPSLPITISMPWLGPFGPFFALPVKYRIYFGQPLHFDGDSNEEDHAIHERVETVKDALDSLLQRGLDERTGIFT
jgi:1-acyl-sn-glycerol-3-phosphate acyltransferase